MDSEYQNLKDLEATADSALVEVASRLRSLLSELAPRLRPFPSFLNMVSIQAIELDLPGQPPTDRGCVVICPDGEIYELNLQAMPGIEGVSELDQLEEFRELSLPTEEYITYAIAAIRLLRQELRCRGGQ